MPPRRRSRLFLLLALTIALVFALAPGRAGADPAIEGPAQRLFQRIMSPYCPGLQLAACPSPQADALRNEIRAALIAGKSSDAIEADLHRRFGGSTRAEPAFAGLGRFVWIAPLVAFLAGGLALIAWLRRVATDDASRPATDDASLAAPGAADADAQRRLDDELAAM